MNIEMVAPASAKLYELGNTERFFSMIFPSGRTLCGDPNTLTILCSDSLFTIVNNNSVPKQLAQPCGITHCLDFIYGTAITIKPTPGPDVSLVTADDSNYQFGSWWAPCSGRGDCRVTAGSADGPNRTVATGFFFTSPKLTITSDGEGTGTVLVQQINSRTPVESITCGDSDHPSPCVLNAHRDTVLRLTSTASNGSRPVWWSGCNSLDRGTCVVNMQRSRTVTVTFARTQTLTITTPTTTLGWASVNTLYENQRCNVLPCQLTFLKGTEAVISAGASAGSHFGGGTEASWVGCDSTSNAYGGGLCAITLSADATITAPLVPNQPVP